jgi:transcriptional regulator with XRE-family HTH domain
MFKLCPVTNLPTDGATLATWLRRLRTNAGLSQETAAARLVTDVRNLKRWEQHEKPTEPSGLALLQMMALYGVEVVPPPPGYEPLTHDAIRRLSAHVAAEVALSLTAKALRDAVPGPEGERFAASLEAGLSDDMKPSVEDVLPSDPQATSPKERPSQRGARATPP